MSPMDHVLVERTACNRPKLLLPPLYDSQLPPSHETCLIHLFRCLDGDLFLGIIHFDWWFNECNFHHVHFFVIGNVFSTKIFYHFWEIHRVEFVCGARPSVYIIPWNLEDSISDHIPVVSLSINWFDEDMWSFFERKIGEKLRIQK